MKLPLTVSIDVDNLWSYMKTHGDKGWEKYPSYFATIIPIVMDVAEKVDVPITFFFVGKDLEESVNQHYVKMVAEKGFTIANHSYHHEPWLHTYTSRKLFEEIERTDSLIREITGLTVSGFRGPGFACSEDLLSVLQERKYLYDCSSLPTFIGPLARMYYFKSSKLSFEDRNKRTYLFGKWREGFKKNRPHYIKMNSGFHFAEIPVTTYPLIKTPIHLSYLIYLYRFRPWLMWLYLRSAVFFLKIFKTPLSFLLHPLDFIGGDKVEELSFFPGMDMDSENKTSIAIDVLNYLGKHFEVLNMDDYYKRVFHVEE